MKILHAFWLPDTTDAFVQGGSFRLWVETVENPPAKRKNGVQPHPFHLPANSWQSFLETLGAKDMPAATRPHTVDTCSIRLPSGTDEPLPSPQLAKYRLDEIDAKQATLECWDVDCFRLTQPLKQLNNLHFLALHRAEDVQPGSDFLFWHWFTHELKRLLVRDQYLPALVYRQPGKPKGKRKLPPPELYGSWQWAPDPYDTLIANASECMPAVCAAATDEMAETGSLLRHCAEVLLDQTVRQTPMPAVFTKKIRNSLIAACLDPARAPWNPPSQGLDSYHQWVQWRRRIVNITQDVRFTLGFQLREPPEAEDKWTLVFVAVPNDDPSQRLALADYWSLPGDEKERLQRQLGAHFEAHVLLHLGLAARMVPKLWAGLDNAEPQALALDLDEAFTFLKESAWLLEDAGYKFIVPAWWTVQGRRRFRIRLRTSTASGAGPSASGGGHVNLENLVQFSYQLAIGDQVLSEQEFQDLLEAKSPLVKFRGQWVELDRDKMQEMLAFWQKEGSETPQMSIQELLQRTATDESFEVDREDALAGMLASLHDHSHLEPITQLPNLRAELRTYQRRGVAWLCFLEQLGLNGCLADDMGLGKTMQVIARLVQERDNGETPGPSLLVAPTSVIGNWQKEIDKFAPQLHTLVHHGPERVQNSKTLKKIAATRTLVVTSYALARRDQNLLATVTWHRVILDEAQNIKNPKAAQTKAVLKFQARHRLALTGTPVENRLMDLWSIFNFANPGYLDTQSRFRKRFELPVQRDNDPVQTATLKRLVEPFVLRRVKTDKSIIQDLPDKVEALQYCNLSKEQAALYEAVVRDTERQLDAKDGIERQGLMLSTLMKLKQICNHPAQFLQDGSAFTAERSHKLERLCEMLEETMATGDSVLVFTQFTEVGVQLQQLLKSRLHCDTYYLHGGTSRTRREAMIEAFQDPETEPSIFVLSLKAGGVGITLTKANHVFHFDRWWNPAVEDQASDRAFRIGQEKNVFVHKFVTLGTLEERINDMIEEKKALAGAVVGTDESWLAQLDNESFKTLIRLNQDAVME